MTRIISLALVLLVFTDCAPPTGSPGLSLGSGGVFSSNGSGGSGGNSPTNFASPGTYQGTLDPNTVSPVNLASDFASWPETTHIKKIELRAGDMGVRVTMDNGRPDAWPDTGSRPGFQGPLYYTIGLAEKINGQWYMSAPIQIYRGAPNGGLGGPIQDQMISDGTGRGQIQANWFYDNRWAPMAGYQPKPGEIVGMFICAGDCRDGNPNYSPVHERSNIVLFAMPNDGQPLTLNIP